METARRLPDVGTNPPPAPHVQTRGIALILVKALLVHIFGLINYGHLNYVLNIPKKHNAHVLRLVAFCFFPTIALSALIIDAFYILSRFLQNPDETSWPALNFYLHGFLGVRAIKKENDEESGAQTGDAEVEATRLVQLPEIDSAHHEPLPWTWKRYLRIGLVVLALLQGTGTITLWARRIIMHATISLDTRTFYMACGSTITSILSLTLLLLSPKWTYTPDVHGHLTLPRWPETRRFMVEIILAGIIQECASHFGSDEVLPRYPTSLWAIAPSTALEWVVFGVGLLVVQLFRRDLEAKMGVKLQPVGFLLLAVGCGWVVVDAVGLVVVDIIGVVNFDRRAPWRGWARGYEAWRDPWQPVVPVI